MRVLCRSHSGWLVLLMTGLLVACGGGGGGTPPQTSAPPPPPPVTYTAKSGIAQKGPLIKGSTVTAQELDAALSPTGKQYSYQIDSDLGTFTPTSTFGSQYIGLNATGYYFDEIQNGVSSGTVTLDSYSDLSADTVVNVNLLTTLAYQRIKNLVTNSRMTFSAARTQAEGEVLAALNIPTGSYGAFGTLDLSGGSDGDHILAAVSSLFVYGNQAGQLSALINNFQNDLGTNGTITTAATKAALAAAAKLLNPAAIAANLNQRYTSSGIAFAATDISDWIDRDGDGVVGKFKFQVPDATPSTVFTFPAFVVAQIAGTSITVTAGQLAINGTPSSGSITVNKGDVVTVSPGAGSFPNGVLNVYLSSGGIKVARVSFVNGLLSIAITPATPSIAKGLTQQFIATGTFSDTSTADLTHSVVWTSTSSAVATVSAAGLAQGTAVGSTNITATSGAVSGNEPLTVTAAVVESIAITPGSPRSGVGLNRKLTATGTYSDGTTADVSGLAGWTSDTPTVATVDNHSGVTTGVSLGSAAISATIGAVTNNVTLAIIGNTWSPAATPAHARASHTATLLANGTVLVAGGQDTSTLVTASVETYDPTTDIWTPASSLLIARQNHTATLLPNGKVLVVGGSGTGTNIFPMTNAEIYDPAANTWTAVAPMASPRISHTATLLPNGKVLVVGGTTGPGGPLNSAEIYDPAANIWSATATLPVALAGHNATLLANGTVLITGGRVPSGPYTTAIPSNGLIYDPSADRWTNTANLVVPRSGHTATLLANGQVLIAGGLDQSSALLATTELYDPVANTWSAAGTLLLARYTYAATLLPNGKILLSGGAAPNPADPSGPSIATNSAELYDPTTNISSAAGSLITGRESHTATLLPNGVVLVVGGYSSTSNPIVAAAELYW